MAIRTGKVIGFCALGYAALWLATVLGTLGVGFLARENHTSGENLAGINHFTQVDDVVWRGSAPGPDGYEALADRGIHTVVDLRAEDLSEAQLALPEEDGLNLVRMPIRDGQTPTEEQVDEFLATVENADGPVFVHCGAGVGRTGAIAAAYLVRTDQASSTEAAARNLAVGPPSVEQVYYALTTDSDKSEQPPVAVQAVSRVLDAPRRINASLDLF
ncbi:fused DSP-PTPase phosphatase/NAD kinase-like protein [Streptomyces litchfieldiae]|uniref:Dual specificity protein phosphatase family protein n=1 Tax=Streptomyces litchfieldiae TaxID=3075543 RepID=A0ABU2MNZ4_9ACTN|nr:dual specificity protein phosphatase family protein [Streptomyces sp. DSM 44938]MDT0343063.1 dual specificity protein phosphatase family protein [Streptomyces sp. DSM 44938]